VTVRERTSTSSPSGVPEGAGRFEGRSALGLVALLVGALPFLLLLLLVRQEWELLRRVDEGVADGLNEVAARSPLAVDVLQVVTDLGGNVVAVYVFLLTAAFLEIRGQRRLAAYVSTTGIGLAVIVPLTKLLVGRDRPAVPLPVSETPSNASFPSGHAMVSLVTWTVVALVLMPAVRHRLRPWLLAAALLVTLAVGLTRLALGVHFVSDVLAGWALGAGWLAVTTAAFRGWRHDEGRSTPPLTDGLDPDPPPELAPRTQPVLPQGGRTVLRLAVAAVAIFVGLSALGLLVTGPLLETALGGFDRRAVAAFVELRTPLRTEVVRAVSALSGTPMVVALGVAQAVLALAVTRRWRPSVFVAVVILGEVALLFVTAELVGRARPEVRDLVSGLPAGASWPSGHTAAAVTTYGALAVLVVLHGRSRWRWAVLALPVVLAPLIGATRIYLAAHHPTDVGAGLLLGTLWLLACTRELLLRPEGAASVRR
jgi:membrane-associated phospholipid phosphatase